MSKKIVLTCDWCSKQVEYAPDFDPKPKGWTSILLSVFAHDMPTQYFCSAACQSLWEARQTELEAQRTLTTEDEHPKPEVFSLRLVLYNGDIALSRILNVETAVSQELMSDLTFDQWYPDMIQSLLDTAKIALVRDAESTSTVKDESEADQLFTRLVEHIDRAPYFEVERPASDSDESEADHD